MLVGFLYTIIQRKGEKPLRLTKLLQHLKEYYVQGNLDKEITSITNHSGQVGRGDLFICVPGLKSDGHHFASIALARGAEALVLERDVEVDCTKIFVKDAREAQAWLSHAFYGNPTNSVEMIGVTGTNGKTTTTYFIESILNQFGRRAGRIGTINYQYGNLVFPSKQTTPDSIDLHKILWDMVKAGTKSVVMEVSSHGLVQSRVHACNFDVGILSNVTHDHFDFHKNFENYLESKAKLFAYLGREGKTRTKYGVVNADDPSYTYIAERCCIPLITYGIHSKSEVRAHNIELRNKSSSFDLVVGHHRLKFNLPLPGLFNIYNALASAAYAWGRKLDLEGVKSAIEKVSSVPGRCQRIELGQDFEVMVDFAHNPDGLKNILNYAPKTRGTNRLVVFGCEGGKDRTKRQSMGDIAGTLSDFSIITMDNLYSENPMEVAEEIAVGLKRAGKRSGKDYLIILDRAEAIKTAINLAKTGDQVIIAGKGHETTQRVYEQVNPFCDCEVVTGAIEERLHC